MEDKKPVKIIYNAIIESIDADTGEITKTSKVHNLVVTTGLNRIANLIGGLSSTSFGYMAIGETITSPVAGNTALGSEAKRSSVTPTLTGTGVIEYDHTFSFGSGESFSIKEAGLFDAVSSGTMLNRLVFSAHAVDVNNFVRCRITLTIA